MILDDGICRVSKKINVAGFGEKPRFVDQPFYEGWYAELNFETAPAYPTENREETQTDARVRVLQNREINNHDHVTLSPFRGEMRDFEVIRAYHGRDNESGELISDLSLRLITP